METLECYFIAANRVVWQKIADFCRYQPRSHQQVRQKLYGWKLAKSVVEPMLAALIEAQLVSESNFATAYAGERFRINRWGKNKVRQALQKRQISPYCIARTIAAADPVQYEKDLQKLAEKKWSSFSGKGMHPCIRSKKTAAFLIGRGFESAVVWDIIRAFRTNG